MRCYAHQGPCFSQYHENEAIYSGAILRFSIVIFKREDELHGAFAFPSQRALLDLAFYKSDVPHVLNQVVNRRAVFVRCLLSNNVTKILTS
jgi:hypothetical protein